MRVCVFGDVHGNLLALERLVSATEGSVDSYLCLGDVVNYGPFNDECLQVVSSLPRITLLEGNHERLFLGTSDVESEPPLVRDFFGHSRASFSCDDLIRGLPRTCSLNTFQCEHTISDRRIYADTPIYIDGDRLIGHTHHQYRVERSGFVLLNPGSVGQNRRWIDVVDYAVLDTETGEVELLSARYDVDAFIAEMRARHYSESCLSYYADKPRRGA